MTDDDENARAKAKTHLEYLEHLRAEIERSQLPSAHKRTALERLEAFIASPGVEELINTAIRLGL